MRNLTGLLAAAMLVLTSVTADAAPKWFAFGKSPKPPRTPITLSVAWVTAPCHEDGRLLITVTNVSDREIVMPIQGPLAADGLFKGAARVAKAKQPVFSDNLATPPAPLAIGDVLPVRPVAPNQWTTYRVDFNRHAAPGATGVALDAAYAALRRAGGEVWVVYALPKAPDPTQPYVVASERPIVSNKLTCPA